MNNYYLVPTLNYLDPKGGGISKNPILKSGVGQGYLDKLKLYGLAFRVLKEPAQLRV